MSVDLDRVAATPNLRQTAAEIVRAAAESGRTVDVNGHVHFGQRGVRYDHAALALLQEAASRLIPIGWELGDDLDDGLPWSLRTVAHLPPPRRAVHGHLSSLVQQWQELHSDNACSYRFGPGFTVVRDTRVGGPAIAVTIKEPENTAFRTLVTTCRPLRTPQGESLVSNLVKHDLALRLAHDMIIVLPYRRRVWPIAARGVPHARSLVS